jgi:hypothetical protein
MPDIDDATAQRLKDIETEGKRRFGDATWANYVRAIGRANPNGIPQDVLRATLSQSNAEDVFAEAGRHCLMDAASNGDNESERAYSEIRAAERKAFRERRGR